MQCNTYTAQVNIAHEGSKFYTIYVLHASAILNVQAICKSPLLQLKFLHSLLYLTSLPYITLSKCSLVKPDPTCTVLINCILGKDPLNHAPV